MLSRTRFGSNWFTMSIRMCSLSSRVQGEHSRKTMPNRTHCSSSQELDEVSKVLRTMALTVDTITATRMSQARRLPVHLVNASIPRLIFRSDCNDGPPPGVPLPYCFTPLAEPAGHHGFCSPNQHEAGAPNQRVKPPSIGSWLILWGNPACAAP